MNKNPNEDSERDRDREMKQWIFQCIKSNQKHNIPMAILGPNLLIRWRNNALRKLREKTGLRYRKRPFPALFSTFADPKIRNELISSLKSSKKGFSWQGFVKGKGRNKKIFESNITIVPIAFNRNKMARLYAAIMIDLTESNKVNTKRIFDSILRASLLKDRETGDHIKRVNNYSRILAQKMLDAGRFLEVDQDFVDDIGMLAAFHDVGKIGTPDRILTKNGPLDEQEWLTMKEHPIQGAIIMASHPNEMARDIVKAHHERWDGTGYPFELKGEDIPIAARVVSITDVYDALRTARSYKVGYSQKETLGIMEKDVGTHFDPQIFEVFLSISSDFDNIFNRLK